MFFYFCKKIRSSTKTMVQRLFYKYAIIDCKGDDFYGLDL